MLATEKTRTKAGWRETLKRRVKGVIEPIQSVAQPVQLDANLAEQKQKIRQGVAMARENGEFWLAFEADARRVARGKYGANWEDILQGACELFIRYNHETYEGYDEKERRGKHLAFAKLQMERAFNEQGFSPTFRSNNTRSQDEEEFGCNVRLASYEEMVENGYDQPSQCLGESGLASLVSIGTIVESLPPKYQSIVKLRMEGITHDEVGTILGVSRVRVTQMLKEIRQIVRDGLLASD